MKSGLICGGYEKTFVFRPQIVCEQVYRSGVDPAVPTSKESSSGRGNQLSASSSLGSIGRNEDLAISAPGFKQPCLAPLLQGLFLLPGQLYRLAFLDKIIQMSMPVVKGDPICAQWMTFGCREAIRNDQSALALAVLSCAIFDITPSTPFHLSRPELMQISLPIYSKALRTFRSDLSKQMTDEQQELQALTAFFFHIYEISATASISQSCRHADGIGLILTCRGPNAIRSTCLRTLFCEYRVIDFIYKVIQGRSSLLARGEWLHPSWRKDFSQMNNPLHRLLDISLQLPGMIETFHQLEATADTEGIGTLLHDVLQISEQVDKWQQDLAMSMARHLCQGDHKTPAVPILEIEAAMLVKQITLINQMNLLCRIRAYNVKNGSSPINQDCKCYLRKAFESLSSICLSMDFFFQDDLRMTGRKIFSIFIQTALLGLPEIDLSVEVHDLCLRKYCERFAATATKLEAAGFFPWGVTKEKWRYFADYNYKDGENEFIVASRLT
jgi:hypothetical protein